MRINNNIMAMNTYRQLGLANSSGAKSMGKLSSGYRINNAADDAAGLAISEKMRGQIRGLNQASRNAQDGISLIQTAEGALNETHAILQRMRELAVQSSTDTNTGVDRSEIQKEIDELAKEITRIADTTEFNTQNLLGGNFAGKFHIGANEGQDIELKINNMNSDALGVSGTQSAEVGKVADKAITAATNSGKNFADGTYTVMSVDDYTGAALTGSQVTGGNWSAVKTLLVDSNNNIVGTSVMGASDTAVTFSAIGAAADNAITASFGADVTAGEITKVTISDGGTKATAHVGITGDNNKLATGTYEIVDLKNHAIYGHATEGRIGLKDASGKIVALGTTDGTVLNATATTVTQWVDVNDTSKTLLKHTANLGVDNTLAIGSKITVTGSGINVSSQESASKAITTIQKAIETVSAERSKLGAYQNRLEHTIKNLDTSAENLQASESRIRDVDMAKEMMEFTKNNILQQAATAMLAQANQAPQGVLQLLR